MTSESRGSGHTHTLADGRTCTTSLTDSTLLTLSMKRLSGMPPWNSEVGKAHMSSPAKTTISIQRMKSFHMYEFYTSPRASRRHGDRKRLALARIYC